MTTPVSLDPQWGPVVTATVSFQTLGGGGVSTAAFSEGSLSGLFGAITQTAVVWDVVPTAQPTQGA
jgi:hypothetical protein